MLAAMAVCTCVNPSQSKYRQDDAMQYTMSVVCIGTEFLTCLLYFLRRRSSNSLKPFKSRRAAAVMGLLCSDRVKSAVQS